VRVAGVDLSDVVTAVGIRQRAHDHERPFLCSLIAGRYEERIAGRRRTHAPMAVLLHGAGARHADALTAGGRLFGITLGRAWDDRLAELPRFDGVLAVSEPRTAGLLGRLRQESRSGLRCADLAVEGLLLEVLSLLARTPESSAGAVRRAEEALRAHLTQPLRLGQLASLAGSEPGALARGFRRIHGVGPMGYLQRLRVLEAERLIALDVPLVDVAAACGFADQSHLTRVFKRITGSTPARWRGASR
jgi:AraC-like DNA-binding protein